MNYPKSEILKVLTPVGAAVWPYLDAPLSNGKYEPTYKIDVVLAPEDAKPLIAELERFRDEYLETCQGVAGKKKLKPQDLPIEERDDGTFVFKFKARATDKDGNPKSGPIVVDSQKNAMTERVGPGSQVRVRGFATGWCLDNGNLGVKLHVQAVQVLDLAPVGAQALEDFDVEDGYSAPETDNTDGDF